MYNRRVSSPPLPRRLAGDPLIAGSLGGAIVAVLELPALGAGLGLGATLIAIFAATGALAGAVVMGTSALARRLGWQGARAALVHAVPTLAIWIPVSATLFEGAFAATLPGAAAWPKVLPPVLALGVAAAILVAAWWRGRAGRLGVPVIAGALALAFAALWFANHRLFRSGYADLHTGITLCEIVIAGIAVRLAGAGEVVRIARPATAAVVAAATIAACFLGLGDEADRRRVIHRGDDTKHLVHLWRSLLDRDRDGSSALLGGGDCDDGDAARHPGARDLPGNQIDEDCTGADAEVRKPSPQAEQQARSLAEWRALPDTAAALAATRDLNILVISVDALRFDLLGPDAPGRADFPRLTGLLDRAAWFQRAMSPAAGTDVSLSAFVTGRWNPFQPIPTTLLEAMHATGRVTGATFPREVLRYAPEPLLTRGVDHLERLVTDSGKRDVGDHVTAESTTDLAVGVLDKAAGKPFFVWAHYFDVHEHRQLPAPQALVDKLSRPGDGKVERGYRALLRGVDDAVGRLLDELDRRGLTARTAIVLFADHGESLGEDPRLPDNHGVVVYQAMTHVPLAIALPGAKPHVELEPVSLIDLAPTLLDLVGTPTAMEGLDGASLVPSLLGAPEPMRRLDRALVMNESEQWGVVEWPWKLLVRPKDNLTELYDLDADPGERHDLAADHPEQVNALRSRYGEFPAVPMDRTKAGRQWREAQAKAPTSPAR